MTGVGGVDDFLFTPLSVGISKGLIMIFVMNITGRNHYVDGNFG